MMIGSKKLQKNLDSGTIEFPCGLPREDCNAYLRNTLKALIENQEDLPIDMQKILVDNITNLYEE